MFTRLGFTPVSELLTQMDVQSISRLAVCRMLLTANTHILSDLKPYTAEGFRESRPVNESKVLTTSQALNLLKQRGYIIKDDLTPAMN